MGRDGAPGSAGNAGVTLAISKKPVFLSENRLQAPTTTFSDLKWLCTPKCVDSMRCVTGKNAFRTKFVSEMLVREHETGFSWKNIVLRRNLWVARPRGDSVSAYACSSTEIENNYFLTNNLRPGTALFKLDSAGAEPMLTG